MEIALEAYDGTTRVIELSLDATLSKLREAAAVATSLSPRCCVLLMPDGTPLSGEGAAPVAGTGIAGDTVLRAVPNLYAVAVKRLAEMGVGKDDTCGDDHTRLHLFLDAGRLRYDDALAACIETNKRHAAETDDLREWRLARLRALIACLDRGVGPDSVTGRSNSKESVEEELRSALFGSQKCLLGAAVHTTRPVFTLFFENCKSLRVSMDDKGATGYTPLMMVVMYVDFFREGEAESIYRAGVILAQGADINAQDTTGRTALTWAVCEGFLDVVGYLLERGAGVGHRELTSQRTLLHLALNPMALPACEALLLQEEQGECVGAGEEPKRPLRACINSADAKGFCPLQLAAQLPAPHNATACALLLRHGADPATAAAKNQPMPQVVAQLLREGAMQPSAHDAGGGGGDGGGVVSPLPSPSMPPPPRRTLSGLQKKEAKEKKERKEKKKKRRRSTEESPLPAVSPPGARKMECPA